MPQQPSTAIGSRESQDARRQVEGFVFQQAMEQAGHGEALYMRRAKPADFGIVQQMISDAKDRLKDLGTDQWSDDDWSDKAGRGRMARVRYSIEKKHTWIAEFRIPLDVGVAMIPVATVTLEPEPNPVVWDEHERNTYPAVYLSRLVVANEFSSFDIGASIIDWAGQRGWEQRKAKSIRIDVWTANAALHGYYRKRGFRDCGTVSDESYPAGQRFERPIPYDSGLVRPVRGGTRRKFQLAGHPAESARRPAPTHESEVRQPSPDRSLVDA